MVGTALKRTAFTPTVRLAQGLADTLRLTQASSPACVARCVRIVAVLTTSAQAHTYAVGQSRRSERQRAGVRAVAKPDAHGSTTTNHDTAMQNTIDAASPRRALDRSCAKRRFDSLQPRRWLAKRRTSE